MATLWVAGSGYLFYSLTGGTLGSWVEVPADPTWPLYSEMTGVYGPSNTFKVYVAVEELGVAYWDGTGWTTDYDTGGVGPWPFWRPPDVLSLWCSANDDLVLASAFGDNNDQIVVRQGGPGSEWFVEFGDGVGDMQPRAVHGSPDGSHVFALAYDWNTDDTVLFKRTAGSPSKSNLLTETGIDTVGDDEVHRNVVVSSGVDQLQIKVQSLGPPYYRGGVFAKLGSAPTELDFDYEFYPDGPALHALTIPSPAAGTWYFMLKAYGWYTYDPPTYDPVWHPSEGFNDLSLEVNEISGLGTWAEVARRTYATDRPYGIKIQVVSDTEVYFSGECWDGVGYNARIWKWNGSSLSVVFTGDASWRDRIYYDCVGLWVNPDGSEGWACFHGDDVGNAYEKFVRFNGTTWSFFQAVEKSYIIHDVTQLPGDINSAYATYGYGEYDIFNLLGGNVWPNDYYYGYPPIENYRSVKYPGGSITVSTLYLSPEPAPPGVERRQDEIVTATDATGKQAATTVTSVLAGINKLGTDGAVLKRNAATTAWDELHSFAGASNLTVYDVKQFGLNYIAAVIPYDATGSTAFFWVYEGGSWVDKSSLLPAYTSPHSLFVAGVDDIWIGGYKTQSGSAGEGIWHYDGASVTQKYLSTNSSTAKGDAIGGVDTNLVYLAGQRVGYTSGRLTRVSGGSTVTQWLLPGTTTECYSISVLDSSNIYIGGTHGLGYAGVYHFDGAGNFTDIGNPGGAAQVTINGLWARSTSEVWATGTFLSGGTGAGIWKWNGSSWSLQQNPTWTSAQGRSAIGFQDSGEAWFGVWGTTTQRIFYWNGSSFSQETLNTTGDSIRRMSAVKVTSVAYERRQDETVTAADSVSTAEEVTDYTHFHRMCGNGGWPYPAAYADGLRIIGDGNFNTQVANPSGGVFVTAFHRMDNTYMVAVPGGQYGAFLSIWDSGVWSNVDIFAGSDLKEPVACHAIARNSVVILAKRRSNSKVAIFHWNGSDVAFVVEAAASVDSGRGYLAGKDNYILMLGPAAGTGLQHAGGDPRSAGSWTSIPYPGGDPGRYSCQRIIVFGPTEAYATTYAYSWGGSGVFKWTGSSWSSTGAFPGGTYTNVAYGIARAPDGTLWCHGYAHNGMWEINRGFYKKTTTGSWTYIQGAGYNQICGAISQENPLHLAFGGSDYGYGPKYWESLDGGATWAELPGTLPSGSNIVGFIEAFDAPALFNLSPNRGETNVSAFSTVVTGEIRGNVVPATITITIRGTVAWSAGSLQNGFTGSVSLISNRYVYSLTAPWPFPMGTVVYVEAYAENLDGNASTARLYSFTTEYPTFDIRHDEVLTADDTARDSPHYYSREAEEDAGLPDLVEILDTIQSVQAEAEGLLSTTETPALLGDSRTERWTSPVQTAGEVQEETGGHLDPTETPELLGDSRSERWTSPIQEAGALELDTEGLPDSAGVYLGGADYMQEKDDSDAHELLGGGLLTDVIAIDATVGGFGNPTTNNHWGAAKDGKFYADGVECAPGDFGTVAGGFRDTAWSFSGRDPMGQPLAGTALSMPSDDVIQFGGYKASWSADFVSSIRRWCLQGDFDVQIDYLNFTPVSGESVVSFGVVRNQGGNEGSNIFYCYRHTSNLYYAARIINGGWANLGTVGTTDTSGKLRITRTGGVLQAYYWNGSWVALGASYSHANLSGDLYVEIIEQSNNGELNVQVSNFQINSGTTSNRSAWYREASGDHRGTQPDMPDHLAVACTNDTLDLVDTDTNKLWMRFLKGANLVLHNVDPYRPRRVRWDDGVLYLAFGSNPTDSNEGSGILIDFTSELSRLHRESGSTVTGGLFTGTARRVEGSISTRNATWGWSFDDNTWQTPQYRHFDVSLYRDAGYEYRANATGAGIATFKWHRWYYATNWGSVERSTSTETDWMRACQIDPTDGTLFYMDSSNLYSVPQGGGSGWEDAMDAGTFTAATTKALPGTRYGFEWEYRFVRYSASYVFVPSQEGVYRVDWPSGSWELFYGKASGTGATHNILPEYDSVTSICMANDGGTDLLLIGLRWDGGFYLGDAIPLQGQLVAVRLDTNTIWAIKDLSAAIKSPRALAF